MSTAPFNEEDVSDILRYLGYPDWVSLAQSIQLGYPAASQPLFLVRDSLDRLTPTARERVRIDLCELKSIDSQLSQGRGRLRATQLGNLSLNPRELQQLRVEYLFWQRRLADDLGVVPNPYSQLQFLGMPGGVSARVGNG